MNIKIYPGYHIALVCSENIFDNIFHISGAEYLTLTSAILEHSKLLICVRI